MTRASYFFSLPPHTTTPHARASGDARAWLIHPGACFRRDGLVFASTHHCWPEGEGAGCGHRPSPALFPSLCASGCEPVRHYRQFLNFFFFLLHTILFISQGGHSSPVELGALAVFPFEFARVVVRIPGMQCALFIPLLQNKL